MSNIESLPPTSDEPPSSTKSWRSWEQSFSVDPTLPDTDYEHLKESLDADRTDHDREADALAAEMAELTRNHPKVEKVETKPRTGPIRIIKALSSIGFRH